MADTSMAHTRKLCRNCKHRHKAPRGKNCSRMPHLLCENGSGENPAFKDPENRNGSSHSCPVPNRGSRAYINHLKQEISRMEILQETEVLERRLAELQGITHDQDEIVNGIHGDDPEDKVDTPGVDSGLHTTDRVGADSPSIPPHNENNPTIEITHAPDMALQNTVTMGMQLPSNTLEVLNIDLAAADIGLPMNTISTWVGTTSPTSMATHTTVTKKAGQGPVLKPEDPGKVSHSPTPLDYISGDKPMKHITYTEYIQACLKVLEIGLYTEPSAAIDYLHHVMFLAETAVKNTCSTEALIRYDKAFHSMVARKQAQFGHPDEELCALYLRRGGSGATYRSKYGQNRNQNHTFDRHKGAGSNFRNQGDKKQGDSKGKGNGNFDKERNHEMPNRKVFSRENEKKNLLIVSKNVDKTINNHQADGTKPTSPDTKVTSGDKVLTSEVSSACRRWNYAKCNDARSCRRDHVCLSCGEASHKIKTCEKSKKMKE